MQSLPLYVSLADNKEKDSVRDFTLSSIIDMILYYLCVCHTGSGVSLILDCVGGSYWQQNTDVLTTDSRWVLYGLMGKIYIF